MSVLRAFYGLRNEAQSHRIANEIEQAIEDYYSALSLWPGHEDCLYYLSNCLIEVGDEHSALATLERMIGFQPKSSGGWMQIGRLRLPGGDASLDDLAAARSAFEHCHALNKEESGPELMLGIAELLAGEVEQAEQRFSAAARKNPRSIEARWFGGRAAWLRGDSARALELLTEARALADAGESAGDSASNEGDTAGGRAMTARRGIPLAPPLERWKTMSSRPLDIEVEYGEANGQGAE